MNTKSTGQFNIPPYYDDFDVNKNFYRLMFRPGYAVQARELTQIQTLLQSQIEHFGNHVFKDGSLVSGGQSTEKKMPYVRVQTTYNGYTINPAHWVGYEIYNVTDPQIRGRVTYVVQSESTLDPYAVVFFEYLSGAGEFGSADVVKSSYTGLDTTTTVKSSTVDANIPLSGTGTVVSVAEGIFYVDGFFAHNVAQTTVPYHVVESGEVSVAPVGCRVFESPSARVGFQIVRSVVSASDDASLNDPASGSYNYNAPGADRYKIDLIFGHIPFTVSASSVQDTTEITNFIELLRYENGVVTKKTQYPGYSELEETLARRTYDESGSYTVRPFPIEVREHAKVLRLYFGTNLTNPSNLLDLYIHTATGEGRVLEASDAFLSVIVNKGTITATQTLLLGKLPTTTPDPSETVGTITSLVDNNGVYSLAEGGDPDKLAIGLGAGKAYVNGFEFETLATTYLPIDKARTSDHVMTVSGYNIDASIGGYVLVDKPTSLEKTNAKAFSLFNTLPTTGEPEKFINLYSATIDDAGLIGQARFRQWQTDPATGQWRIYLYNPIFKSTSTVDGGKYSFADVNYLGISYVDGTTKHAKLFDIATEGKSGDATLYFASDSVDPIAQLPVSTIVGNVKALQYRAQNAYSVHFTYNSGTTYQESDTVTTANARIRFIGNGDATTGKVTDTGVLAQHYFLYITGSATGSCWIDLSDIVKYDVITNNDVPSLSSPGTVRIILKDLGSGSIPTTDFDAILITDVDVNDDQTNQVQPAVIKQKVYTPNFTLTDGATVNGQIVSTQLPTSTTDDKYGIVSLYVPDVVDLIKVSQVTAADGTTAISPIDVTSQFTLYTSDSTSCYYNSYIERNDGSTVPDGAKVEVVFNYFAHVGTQGPYIVNSYTDFSFDLIPNISETQINLRNIIDSRPDVAKLPFEVQEQSDGSLVSGISSSKCWIPVAGQAYYADYDYYVSRIDKIALGSDRRFRVIRGTPSLTPVAPPDDPDAMTMYVIRVNPYTFSRNDVDIQFVENKRYTMRDIGKLEKRIEHLEYYTLLSMLEQDTQTMTILDNSVPPKERFKNGFLVDNFKGHSIGDISHPDYICSMDESKGELRPAFDTLPVDFEIMETPNPLLTTSNDGVVTLGYTNVSAISQGLASSAISVNPFNVVNWLGSMSLSPSSDIWIDTNKKPDLIVGLNGKADGWRQIARYLNGINPTSAHSKVEPVFHTSWDFWTSNIIGENVIDTSTSQNSNKVITSESNNTVRGVETVTTVARDTVAQTIKQTRTGVIETVVPQKISKSLGTRVVDVSVVPYIRSKTVVASSSGLKPITKLYAFFDKENVTEVCETVGNRATMAVGETNTATSLSFYPNAGGDEAAKAITRYLALNQKVHIFWTVNGVKHSRANMYISAIDYTSGLVTLSSPTDGSCVNFNHGRDYEGTDTEPDSFDPNDESIQYTPYYVGTLFSDSRGDSRTLFNLPGGRFRTGEKMFRLTDSASNDVIAATTSSESMYQASGLIETVQSTSVSVRVPTIKRTTVTDERVVTKVVTRNRTTTDKKEFSYHDPLAQTFLIDASQYPSGLFVSSVSLFFRNKDNALPVQLQIRPTDNGYPHSSTVLPFADVTLPPEMVNVSENPGLDSAASATEFKFSSPVYLQPGVEYALVVMSNSAKYETWVAEIGKIDVRTSRRISEQAYLGSMFKSQNSSTWTPDQMSDLMFDIKRCKFYTDMVGTYEYRNKNVEGENTAFEYSLCNIFSQNLTLPDTQLGFRLAAMNAGGTTVDNYIPIITNENIEFSREMKMMLSQDVETLKVAVDMYTSNDAVSPVIDLDRFSGLLVHNIVNSRTNDPTEKDAFIVGDTGAWARYITRRVNLASGFESQSINVFLTASIPQSTNIEVYVATIAPGAPEVAFESAKYIQLTPTVTNGEGNPVTTDRDDYREYQYVVPGTGVLPPFGAFVVKICMFSSNSAFVPKIRNMRAIALDN